MHFIVLGAVALIVLIGLAQVFVRTDARVLIQTLRYAVGTGLLLLGGVFLFAGRLGFGLPMLVLGASAIFRGRIFNLDLSGGHRPAGGGSKVRSAYLEMRLDHETGDLRGTVSRGEFSGRELDSLETGELLRLHREIAGDGDSRALFEAYLDRRMPTWREHVEGDAAAGTARPPNTGAMTKQEAYEVLGLFPGAGNAEIRAAHRRLMKRVHPDRGGSTFLAARINEAKDFLLSRHR
jgi:DnaJ domain